MTLTDAAALLSEHRYPATRAELADAYGGFEMDLPNGTEAVGTALARGGEGTFDDPDEAVLALYAGVSDKAVGRVGYSDRDPVPIGTAGPDPVSF